MTWLAWRQFRLQALVSAGLLAAFAALLIVTGLNVRDLYDSLGGARCHASAPCTVPPVPAVDRPLTSILGPVLLAIPALLGMFWGAPLVARELESGTFRLAWTQSVTRRRWLLVRITLVGVAALAIAGLASWLVSWWFAPFDAVNMNRFEPGVFDVRGIVAIGYAGFAFALGVAAGALTRRLLPAMVATLIGFIAARAAFTLWVRPHLLPAKETFLPVTQGKGVSFLPSPSGVSVFAEPPPIPNAWVTSTSIVDRSHHALSAAQLHDLLVRVCPAPVAGSPPGRIAAAKGAGVLPEGVFTTCQQALSHYLRQLVAYQPPGHWWPLQALETGIFLLAALALIGATVWRIGRRPAARKPAAGDPSEQAATSSTSALTPLSSLD